NTASTRSPRYGRQSSASPGSHRKPRTSRTPDPSHGADHPPATPVGHSALGWNLRRTPGLNVYRETQPTFGLVSRNLRRVQSLEARAARPSTHCLDLVVPTCPPWMQAIPRCSKHGPCSSDVTQPTPQVLF